MNSVEVSLSESLKKSNAKKGVRKKIQTQAPQVQQKKTIETRAKKTKVGELVGNRNLVEVCVCQRKVRQRKKSERRLQEKKGEENSRDTC